MWRRFGCLRSVNIAQQHQLSSLEPRLTCGTCITQSFIETWKKDFYIGKEKLLQHSVLTGCSINMVLYLTWFNWGKSKGYSKFIFIYFSVVCLVWCWCRISGIKQGKLATNFEPLEPWASHICVPPTLGYWLKNNWKYKML